MAIDKKQTVTTKAAATTKCDAFVKHLEASSVVVQSWPAWKQELLGGTSDKRSPGVESAPECATTSRK